MNLSKSIDYVKTNSENPFDHARLEFILSSTLPRNEELREIIVTQRTDGSWSPFWAPDRSSLNATCYRLALLEQVGIKKHSSINRSMEYLSKQMNDHGYFEEDNSLVDLCPPWAKPGDIKARLYITANCAFWINYYTAGLDKRVVSYLLEHSRDGRVNSFLHTTWLIGGLLFSLGLIKEARVVLLSLTEHIDEMSPDNLSWLINTLIVSGVDKSELIIESSVARLASLINDDGSWSSDDGTWKDIHTTIEAIRALKFASNS